MGLEVDRLHFPDGIWIVHFYESKCDKSGNRSIRVYAYVFVAVCWRASGKSIARDVFLIVRKPKLYRKTGDNWVYGLGAALSFLVL